MSKGWSKAKHVNCQYCTKELTEVFAAKHEAVCYLNPSNIVPCQVCGKPLQKKVLKTCKKCTNTYYRSGTNNPNWKQDRYVTTCFLHHKKECVVCGESNVIDVHHLDEDRNNNEPRNLIPLCPTHHRYWHSQFRHLIESKIQEYLRTWVERSG